ncbi:TetR/AcrR family transcriptional regulator [Streptomyces echinoruber]|uniref:TetR/AcrR family transcriptional regulator n=1 Tax=Streptomyces echinoruber TaxID=68898 RepID=UPI00167E9EDF|nr:TetR/AcrR family transcriptional regulator [Streptomyces echinoruber]
MAISRRPAAPVRPASPRRRGAVLERAILEAALEQLGTVGWNGLTMEGVAAGAQTGKAAVYRRWPSKEDLVADALRSGLPPLDHAPDTGSLREDLLALCRMLRDAMRSRPGNAVRSVIHECDQAQAERFQSVIIDVVVEPVVKLIREIATRGIQRGEVRPEAANGYVFDALPAMMMYRTKMYGCEWDDPDLEALVDQLMLPLLRRDGT